MTSSFTIKDPKAPASDAQVKFLKSLLETREESADTRKARFCFETGAMTKGRASEFITTIKAQPWNHNGASTEAAAAAVEMVAIPGTSITVSAPVAEIPTPEFGYYLTTPAGATTEQLFYFDKPKNAYAPKLKKLVVGTTYTGAKKAKWINMGGTISAKQKLAGVSPLTADEAGALGKKYGVCVRCGATLVDPVSVAQGLGPVCIKYWSK